MTETEARHRAEELCAVMNGWSVHSIRRDGTVLVEIEHGRTFTLVEFCPEHWAAIDALRTKKD